MKKEIPTFPVSVHLLIFDDNKILLSKRKNTGFCDGFYSLPSGKLENNESVSQCMIREAKEELDINLEKFNVIHIMNRKGIDSVRIDYFFLCKKYNGVIKNNEVHKCGGLKWCDVNELPKNTIGYVKSAINDIMNNQSFSEYGWEKME